MYFESNDCGLLRLRVEIKGPQSGKGCNFGHDHNFTTPTISLLSIVMVRLIFPKTGSHVSPKKRCLSRNLAPLASSLVAPVTTGCQSENQVHTQRFDSIESREAINAAVITHSGSVSLSLLVKNAETYSAPVSPPSECER